MRHPPGRSKGEYRGAQHEGAPVSAPTRGARTPAGHSQATRSERFHWQRALLLSALWAVAMTTSEALSAPHAAAPWHTVFGVAASMVVLWMPVGLIIIYAAFQVERRITHIGDIAACLFALMALLAALLNVVWWLFEQLGHRPPAMVAIDASLISLDRFLIDLWTLTVYGGFLAAVCILVTQLERARRAHSRAQIEHRRAQAQLYRAEIEALRSQVDPAFVRRSLAEVQRRYGVDPAAADQLLDLLVGFLRCAMPGVRQAQSTLGGEIELVRAYARLRQALDASPHGWHIDAVARDSEIAFPPLLLIPMIDRLEAAPTLDGGWFALHVSQYPGGLLLTMDGPGRYSADWLPEDLLARSCAALRATCGQAWRLVIADPATLVGPAVVLCLGQWPAVETARPFDLPWPLAA